MYVTNYMSMCTPMETFIVIPAEGKMEEIAQEIKKENQNKGLFNNRYIIWN